MSTIAERIIQVCDEKEGGNRRQFAIKIKVSPAYISQIAKNPDLVPSELVLDKICETYGVNHEWLTEEIGDPYPDQARMDKMGEIGAAAAKRNVEAVREVCRTLGDKFTDEEILYIYEIFARHFGDPLKEKEKD